MLFGGIFDLISRIIFGAKSDQNRIDGFKLDNVFNELFAKSLYLLPLFKSGKVVSATGFEPVILACKPLKTLDLFLGTDFNRFINNPLLTRILCIENL
tara:strand:- start:624 stop:917 length:294 start_codon:yes stop_codon:yes gene_type:complete